MSGLKGTDAGRKLMSDVRAHKGGVKAPAERDPQTRLKDAAAGVAMPDGSYPIRNQTQLNDAVSDWIRTGRSLAVKTHIAKRAKALGLDLPSGMAVPQRSDAP